MVKHAAKIYTLSLYKIFELEFRRGISCTSMIERVMDTTMVYDVTRNGVVNNMKYVECICKKFEERGVLCSHCLYILHINFVSRIPDWYTKKGWTKTTKLEVWNSNIGTREN